MKVTIFTRFWMCCVLFAASVVNSLAAPLSDYRRCSLGWLVYQRDADNAAKVVLSNDDNKWKIDEAGKYDVKLNTADMTI